MEGSATKGLESNDCDAAQSSSSIVSRMYVDGYDTSLSGHDFVMSMKKHFDSCGEVLHVYIPGYCEGTTLNRFALIYLRGEGAEEEALKLNGSCMGGHKLVVQPYPFHAKHLDHELAPMREEDGTQHLVFVDGYDTSSMSRAFKPSNTSSMFSPPFKHVESLLFQELSKCGRVLDVHHIDSAREAFVYVRGIDTVEKLLQLRGCDRKGLENIKVNGVAPPEEDGSFTCDMSPMRIEVLKRVPYEDPNLPRPPCLGKLLPKPCDCRVNAGIGYCPSNTGTGTGFHSETALTVFASSSRYAPEDPNLPKPWKALVDNTTGYGYFWNPETNVTQYQVPPSSGYLRACSGKKLKMSTSTQWKA